MIDHIIITRYSTLLQNIVECSQYTAVKDLKKKNKLIDIISELLKNDVLK